MTDCILCIDIGTSSLKGAYMADSPKAVAFERYNFLETEPEKISNEWFAGLKAILKNLKEKAPDAGIEAVCISGNGPTICSEDGTTLLWNENAPSSIENTKSLFLPRLDAFRKKFPSQWKNSSFIMGGPEFLIYKLTKNARTILPEERYREIYWTEESLTSEGFSKSETEKFAPFVKPGSLAGKITADAAIETGLLEGTLVFYGAPDFISALLGTNTLSPGKLCDRAGTSEGINLCTERPLNFPGIRVMPSVIPGLWNASVIIPDTGKRFAEFKKKAEKFAGTKITHKNLVALLTSPENSEKIISAELFNEGNKIIRDVSQQIWAALNILKDAAKNAGEKISNSITVTGGQALNERWTQIKCAALGIPLCVTQCVDAELAGDNILARTALGYYDSVEEAAFALVKNDRIYTPDGKEI